MQLPQGLRYILNKKQLTTVPLHLYDKFRIEWKNNFVNKIIQDHYDRSESRAGDYEPSVRQQKLEKEDNLKITKDNMAYFIFAFLLFILLTGIIYELFKNRTKR